VRYYSATVDEIDRELEVWARWRSRQLEQEPEAHSDSACIARAISFWDVSSGAPTNVGRRLTQHEVDRYADEINVIDDQTGRGPILRAGFRWGFCAETEFPASGLEAVWIIASPPPHEMREPAGDDEPLFVEEE
jgi:hypothetical protein